MNTKLLDINAHQIYHLGESYQCQGNKKLFAQHTLLIV
jgi:hypothetical protein